MKLLEDNQAYVIKKGMSFYLFFRYFLSKRSGSLIKFVSRLCVMGVAISVSALIIIVSVMEGFGQAIKSRLLDKQAHLSLSLKENIFLEESSVGPQTKKELFIGDKNKELVFLNPEQKKVIESSQLFESQELILHKEGLFRGVIARGYSQKTWEALKKESQENFWTQNILPQDRLEPQWENQNEIANEGAFLLNPIDSHRESPAEKEALISYDFSLQNDLKVGETFQVLPLGGLLLPPQVPPPVKLFKIVGFFEPISSSVLYYEQGNMDFVELSKSSYEVEIKLKEPDKVLEKQKLFENHNVKNWMEKNSHLFFALKLEKFIIMLFFSIALIISCLGVVSSLSLLMTQKREDIAILQALGSPQRNVTRIFTNIGLLLSSLGLTLGALMGFSLVLFLKYNQFNLLPAMYQDRSIPAVFLPMSYVFILLGCFLLSWFFCYLTSRYFSQTSMINVLKEKSY